MNKITQQELQELQSTIEPMEKICLELGISRIREQKILEQHSLLEKNLEQIKKGLKDKYGDCSINVKTGEFTYEEEE